MRCIKCFVNDAYRDTKMCMRCTTSVGNTGNTYTTGVLLADIEAAADTVDAAPDDEEMGNCRKCGGELPERCTCAAPSASDWGLTIIKPT